MTGKEKYYEREQELSMVGYYATLFMRNFYEENPKRTEELIQKLIKENVEKHGHADMYENICQKVDINMLKLGTKRFAYRVFDLPTVWAKKKLEEQNRKEQKKQKEKEEVMKRVEAFKNKKIVVKVKKSK